MKKRLIAIIFSVIIMLSCFSVFSFAQTTDFSGYTAITTAAQLDAIRYNTSGKYYLQNDIVFTAADFSEGGAFYNEGNYWEPINIFYGVLDGNGYSIKNLEIYCDNYNFYDDFALIRVNSGTVKNLGVENVKINIVKNYSGINSANYAVSAVVSQNSSSGVISNCFSSGNITVTRNSSSDININDDNVAGICGFNYGSVIDCYNLASINSELYAAGVVSSNRGEVLRCYNAGEISSGKYAGGICVSIDIDGTVTDCFNIGAVDADSRRVRGDTATAGGITAVGKNIFRCYNIGELDAYSSRYSAIIGGIVGSPYGSIDKYGDCFCLNGDYDNSIGTKTTYGQLSKAATFTGFDFQNVWEMPSGEYRFPVLRGLSFDYSVLKDTSPQNTTDFAGGNGSILDPYKITDKYQLSNIRKYTDKHFILLNDISFTDADYKRGGDFYNDGNGWDTISEFYGDLNGNNKCIKNFKITATQSGGDSSSFIGTCQGSIYDLEIQGHIEIKNTASTGSVGGVGGIADYVYYGMISGCTNSVRIRVSNESYGAIIRVGGITASVYYGYIFDCTNKALLYGYDDSANKGVKVAGIVADSNYSDVVNCTNEAYISSCIRRNTINSNVVYSSGIVCNAVHTDIINCTNNGYIESRATLPGTKSFIRSSGIIGYADTCNITDCYNSAQVFAESNNPSGYDSNVFAGGIMAYASSANTLLSNCKNSGIITVDSPASSKTTYCYAGGISGYSELAIDKCTNTAPVSTYTAYKGYAGGIVGYTKKAVSNCMNTAKVTANSRAYTSYQYSGGVVGYDGVGKLSMCCNFGPVAAKNDSGYTQVGGVVGEVVLNGNVSDCFNAGALSNHGASYAYVGGIAGKGANEIRCYNVGTVEGSVTSFTYNLALGNIAGWHGNGTTDCYFIGEGSGTFGKPCTEPEMRLSSTFAGFDFDSVWCFDESTGYFYPILKSVPFVRTQTAKEFTPPVKLDYTLGSAIDTAGSEIIIKYDIGANSVIPVTEQMITGFSSESVGTITVTVSYQGSSWNFDVNIYCDHDYQPDYNDDNHFKKCVVCGDTIEVNPHSFANACDNRCDCGFTRVITHNHQPTFDDNNHFEKCTVCGDAINVVPHIFVNTCDADCDCGYVRNIIHNHRPTFDDNNHFKKCVVCGDTIEANPHSFANACDNRCDCGFTRTVEPHKYDNACDKDCNVCKAVRTVEPHKYDNACDTNCNVCNLTREVMHNYDNAFDDSCNGCMSERTPPNTPIKTFTDAKSNAWFKYYMDYAVAYGLFSGTSDTTFSPNADMTRAQFVQVLANLSGAKLDNSKASGFSDAPAGKWFTGAVKWAVDNGIAKGIGKGLFNPTGKIDRQQMCMMLVNYVENYKKTTLKEKVAYKTFADDKEIAGWAKTAVIKCFKAGLVSGTGNNKFSPKVVANRATGATIFTNFHKEYIA